MLVRGGVSILRVFKFRQLVDGGFSYWGYIDGVFVAPLFPELPSDQFIGYKDRKGIDIYENDILQMFWRDGDKAGDTFVMEWDISVLGWSRFAPRDSAEIVGNTYGVSIL